MENELKSNLIACFEAFIAKTKRSPATVAQASAGDWRFFDRIRGGSFTARKYDLIMCWFAENWPDDAEWPDGITRPPSVEKVAA